MLNIDLFPFLSCFHEGLLEKYEAFRRKQLIKFLSTVDPSLLEKKGEVLALRSFQNAARSVPYYKKLLHSRGVEPKSIKTINDFRKLPILDKKIFQECEITDLTLNGSIKNAKNVLTSSGFSGIFSFGVNLPQNLENTARLIDTVLDYGLRIGDKKALGINCLPMGVRIRSNLMTLAEVGVREDMALALIRRFHKYFKQIVVFGEAFFLKHLVEEGINAGILWKELGVSLVIGGDGFPESYRNYMGGLLGISHDKLPMARIIISSLGIAEIDLNLFHETPETILIRRLAEKNEEFKKELFGKDTDTVPMLFQYYPHRTFLETVNEELIITTTYEPCAIPLIRYNTGDRGKIIPYQIIQDLLQRYQRESLLPQLKLPLVMVQSRHSDAPKENRLGNLTRHLIFSDPEVAKRLTGYFIITRENKIPTVHLQLEKYYSTAEGAHEIRQRLAIPNADIKIVPYYEMREALTLNYEKKFRHFSNV